MHKDLFLNPVIVMGMMRSGTTLLAEMVHRGGTPMYNEADINDPSYDEGIKYERPLTQDINREILGLEKIIGGINTAGLPLQAWPKDAFERIFAEVGSGPWGFKDPRTTVTYPVWSEAFPDGPRLYVYRSHKEVLRFYYNWKRNLYRRLKRGRKALHAWITFNEQLLKNMETDQAAGRPTALVSYEELMSEPKLVPLLEKATGVPLFDARNPSLRRNKTTSSGEERIYKMMSMGYEKQLMELYRKLEAARLKVD